MDDSRLQEWPQNVTKPDIDLQQSEIEYIKQYHPDVAIHIEKVLKQMRTKRKKLLKILQDIHSSKIPLVLLNMILNYNILL